MTEVSDRNLLALEALAQAVRFERDSVVIVDGSRIASAPAIGDQVPIVARTAEKLYEKLYLNPRQQYGLVSKKMNDTGLKARFSAALHDANASRFSWVPLCSLISSKDGLATVDSGEGIPGQVPSVYFEAVGRDGMGRLLMDSFKTPEDPNWYFAFGEEGVNPQRQDIVRIYWSITPQGAPGLMARLTNDLNAQRVPFQFKLLRDPQEYGRADAGVLYLPTAAWQRACPTVLALAEGFAAYLQDTTPLLTRRLAMGVGLAEDPGLGTSFGQHRMNLVAGYLWDLRDRPVDPAVQAKQLSQRFQENGYSLERIHLNPSTPADYPIVSRDALLRGAVS